MKPDELEALLTFGREQSGVEFKSACPRDKKSGAFARVVRAILAMSNRRDGGWVVIGVQEEQDGSLTRQGLSEEHLQTWKHDFVADSLSEYADPAVSFSIHPVSLDSKMFLAIRVDEFLDVPTICRKNFPSSDGLILKAGSIYARPRRKPETVVVSSYVDMRDLMDIATQKALTRYLSTGQRAGVSFSPASELSDNESYDRELGDLP